MIIGNSENKEVKFVVYCPKCKNWNDGKDLPVCDDCLEEFMREGTEKPLRFEEK
jgi:hypothetical protein